VDEGAFFLITAGTAVANANSVPGSPRWGRLLDGFREAGVKLLLFVRDGDSGCAAFLGSASDIVLLSDRGEKVPAAIRGLEGLVRVVAGPSSVMRSGGARATVAAAASEAAPPAGWTAASDEGRRRVRALAVAAVAGVLLVVVLILLVVL
jgi:hypothetical protein